MGQEKMFPILNDPIISALPWRFLHPHERQALENHRQTLATLARRGGLSIEEAYCVLKDISFPIGNTWEKSSVRIALMRLIRMPADTYVCPITQLYSELMASGLTAFAKRVASGEFDATKEESDEWARSASGQDAAKHLSPEMRKLLGLDLLN